MFTQKHYVAIADLIHKRRVEIKNTHAGDAGDELEIVNDITLDLVKLFKGVHVYRGVQP